MDILSPAVRTTLRDLRVPSMLTLDRAASGAATGIVFTAHSGRATVHADATCTEVLSAKPKAPSPLEELDWEWCWQCVSPELTAMFADAIIIAANYSLVATYSGVGKYLERTTFADCARAEEILSGAMLELGYGQLIRPTLFAGLHDPANQAWMAPVRASLEAVVTSGRAAFREQYVSLAFPSSSQECDRLMFIPDVTYELLSARSGAGLRTHLVGYDWVAGGGKHKWAVVLVPSNRTTLRYFLRAANAGLCADLGPAERANADVWKAFETIYDQATITAPMAMNVAVTIAATPALVPA